jgi:hypothetical protein
MSKSTSMSSWTRLAAAALVVLTAAPVAQALPPECPLLFPDIRCGRHGRYDGFVPPMMHPYLFEDPFITTGVNAVGIWHEFPGDSILDGGHLWAAALQVRVAITDRVAFVATKDGWVDFEPGEQLLDNRSGFADLGFGVKVAAIDLPEVPFILTPALRFEITQGSQDVMQGNGDGQIIPSVSAAWGYGNLHLLGDVGMDIALDPDANSTFLFYHAHVDYAVHRFFVPFLEIGGMTYVDGGDGSTEIRLRGGSEVPLGVAQSVLNQDPEEGYDYANLGSSSMAGHTVVAGSVGVRVPITKHIILGAAYEYPLSPSRDVLRQRAQAQLTIEF